MRSRPVLPLVGSLLWLATGCGGQVETTDESEIEEVNASGCGVERWAVKTGTDSAAGQINMTPRDTTMAALGAIPVPVGFGANSPRFTYAGSPEIQVYRFTNVTLTMYKLENDSDYHLILRDGTSTMTTEIPSPNCVSGGPLAAQIRAARATFDAKYTVTGSYQNSGETVTITGVGFFDLLHGQAGAAPNGIELHAILSVCFGVNCAGAATPDFALSSSPTSVSDNGSATISATALGGFNSSIALSASGVPAGASATLSPTSIVGGGGSTLTLNKGTAAAGTYTVTVTGTSGALTHATTVTWTITGGTVGGGLVNGDFEAGSLTGWTSTGQTSAVNSGAHGGSYAARVGSTSPSSDSSLSQQVTLPAGSPQLTFWYKIVCPDSLPYDWVNVTIRSPSGTKLATPLTNTCSNGGAWVQGSADLSALAGQTVVLSFNNHDDNYAGDPTYTLVDDVQISGGSTPSPDFTITANPTSVTTAPGASGSAAISTSASNGFTGVIFLSISGAPSGAGTGLSPSSLFAGGGSTLTLSAGTAAPGTYPLTITARSGALSHSDVVTWTITGNTTPDFTVSASPASVTGGGSATISVAGVNGFAGTVALSVSGAPSGAAASLSPASVSGGGNATLSLTPGTAAAGTYPLTITGTSGALSHATPVSWTIAPSGGGIRTVFIILMENHNWSSIKGSSSAPYLNNTLLAQGAHAESYLNVPGIHPSLPNYLWLEAGTNFGILADGLPSQFHQSTTQHLVTQLSAAGHTWKAYQEGISGSTCPLTTSGLYAPKHLPMIFFDDVTNSNSSSSQTCIQHIRPYSELAADLSSGNVASYNFITPNQCDDMHNSIGCATTNSVANGDTWLANNVPTILSSAAYRNGGLLIITWDESEGGNVPIGLIVLSPFAKAGYANNVMYTHSSTLRTLQEIFHVSPFLGDAANATDLSDLFHTFP